MLFSEVPVYLTHTSLIQDLKAIGKVPFRFLMFNLPNSIQVGIFADSNTRIDLVYKALSNPSVHQLLLPKQNAVEMETPPYCVRWTYSHHMEASMREYTLNKTQEQKERIISLFNCLV